MAPERAPTSPAQRYYIPPEGESPQPACKAKPITGRTLGAQGQRPGGAINPHARKGVSTCGNTGKHRPADWYLSRDDSLSACTEILRFAQDDCCPAGLPDPRSRSPIPAAPRLCAPPQPSPLKGKRLTMICASLCSFKSCSLCTPEARQT